MLLLNYLNVKHEKRKHKMFPCEHINTNFLDWASSIYVAKHSYNTVMTEFEMLVQTLRYLLILNSFFLQQQVWGRHIFVSLSFETMMRWSAKKSLRHNHTEQLVR